MDIWTISAILFGAVVVALVLAYLLRSRLSDQDVWQELVDPNAANLKPAASKSKTDNSVSRLPAAEVLSNKISYARAEGLLRSGVQVMPAFNSPPPTLRADLRRSTRLDETVPVLISGTNRGGEQFQERTSVLAFNLHGCRYSSRHEYPRDSWVTLQVTGTDGPSASPVRARVCSIQSGQSARELYQVAVELEIPGNIWGVAKPPEDWQRVLGTKPPEARAAAAAGPAPVAPAPAGPVGPALDPAAPPPAYLPRAAASAERRAEVTVFPNPPIATQDAPPATKDSPATKPERVTFTSEQLLQALQGKLQLAAERAVDTALTSRLDESVRQALGKIDEGWKANLRQTEEFSASRLAEVQNRWERELVVYRSRAEEISRRVEALAASSRLGLSDLQKFAERIKTEIEPQFSALVEASRTRTASDLEAKAGELAEQHKTKFTEFTQSAALQARAQLEETVAELRSLASTAKAPSVSGVSEERLESVVNSSREAALEQFGQRLSAVWTQFEQQQDLARHRADEFARYLETLSTQLNEAKALHEQSVAELRSAVENAGANASPERLEAKLKVAKEQVFNHLEWRLGEVSGRADQQNNVVHLRADELFRRVDGLTADSASVRSQSERSTAELRALLANLEGSASQQHVDAAVGAIREQLLSHVEWRLGEVSGQIEQQRDGAHQRTEELTQRFDAFTAEVRGKLEEHQIKAEHLIQELRPADPAAVEQSAERAAKDFEASAARISDRQLVRLMQQKQTLSNEATVELEARASETRALLLKAANSTLDEFRGRFEGQIDLIVAEATERVASSLASLDAESRAACDTRRRETEMQIARVAEQSTAEFRAGIKAFLYSCLVAAVSGVDEHAQSTLASLGKIPGSEPSLGHESESAAKTAPNGPTHNES
jgi:hypothetical protein